MDSERGKASIDLYQWGGVGHGLVVLSPDGTTQVGIIRGHNYERDKIVEVLDAAMN